MEDRRPGTTEEGTRGELHEDRHVGDRDLTDWSTPAGRAAARSATRTSERIGPHPTLIVVLAIGAVLAFLLAFLASRVYDAVTEADGVASLDKPLLQAVAGLRSPAVDGFAATIAYVFGPIGMPTMAILACGILAIRRRSITPVTLTVAAGAGSLLMTIAGKDVIDRTRPPFSAAIPPFEHSPSFPSGHTLNAMVISGVIAYLLILRRRHVAARVGIGAAALVIAVVVGLTRVLLGAHWFTDVLAGWLLGAAWLALVITAHRLYLTVQRRRHPEAASAASAPGGRAASGG